MRAMYSRRTIFDATTLTKDREDPQRQRGPTRTNRDGVTLQDRAAAPRDIILATAKPDNSRWQP